MTMARALRQTWPYKQAPAPAVVAIKGAIRIQFFTMGGEFMNLKRCGTLFSIVKNCRHPAIVGIVC